MEHITTIDCASFTTPGDLHRGFSEALNFPSHYGCNLDALHDCLTALGQDVKLRLLHWETAQTALGPYGRNARRAILDAATDNPNLAVVFD